MPKVLDIEFTAKEVSQSLSKVEKKRFKRLTKRHRKGKLKGPRRRQWLLDLQNKLLGLRERRTAPLEHIPVVPDLPEELAPAEKVQ